MATAKTKNTDKTVKKAAVKAVADKGKAAGAAKPKGSAKAVAKSASNVAAKEVKAADAKKAPAKKTVKKKAAGKVTEMPAAKELAKLKKQDQGYELASTDQVNFLHGRQQAVYNIARKYHLDPEELFQEGYEILLTCLRDFSPLFEKKDGDIISVQFTTFFGSRMESRAMEMRNRNPEYQARQAYTDGMSADEKTRFRADPPLLVQHLDQETNMQEHLRGEVAMAKGSAKSDIALKIARDSFFDRKLGELVAAEKDEKKRAALLHVKVGGVYNFQEIAYHFGVTDSRASQVMNELMDAFYVQRLIDQDIASVAYDFKKLKFNEKRVRRLVMEALRNANAERTEALISTFSVDYPTIAAEYGKAQQKIAGKESGSTTEVKVEAVSFKMPPPAYEDIFGDEENERFPLVSVDIRSINELKPMEVNFRRPNADYDPHTFLKAFDPESSKYPALVNEDGMVIDGWRRIEAAKISGKDSYLCITRHVVDDAEMKILRVMVNLRLSKPDKTDLYYAIRALAELGLSQQKIADYVGTSRTNVLVYAKVQDKAAPKLRALFEDGLIQITNASSCVDLSEDMQSQLADFIRRYGTGWSKGAKFNKLQQAAIAGDISPLEEGLTPVVSEVKADITSTQISDVQAQKTITTLQKRLEAYEQALKDSEVWSAQREKVIASQTEVLEEAQDEVESLRKELEAVELTRFGSTEAIEEELKQLKKFYALTERLTGATHGMNQAARDVRNMKMKRKQILELNEMMDKADSALNNLRLELLNLGHKQDR